jgi:hypothetical protein
MRKCVCAWVMAMFMCVCEGVLCFEEHESKAIVVLKRYHPCHTRQLLYYLCKPKIMNDGNHITLVTRG